jgi:hypothetical protein
MLTNLFGTETGGNFLMNTLGQNFKQVKETQIQYKIPLSWLKKK